MLILPTGAPRGRWRGRFVDGAGAGYSAMQPPFSPSLWGLPFDTLRAVHAAGVQAGLIRRSMLESRDFERVVVALERAMLGPLARRV